MEKANSTRLKELDALRGIAAVFVVLFHLSGGRSEFGAGFKLGVTGVDLFFLISGFVIFLTLQKTRSWKDFMVSRFSRLYPTYWTCVTITAFLIGLHLLRTGQSPREIVPQYLANLTMFQWYLRVADIDAPYWTLIVEMNFYLYMLIIYLARSLRRIEVIGALSLVATAIYGSSYFSQHFVQVHRVVRAAIPLINHFPLFLAGIVFYRIKFEGLTKARLALLAACFATKLLVFDDGGTSHLFVSFPRYVGMLSLYFVTFSLYASGRLGFIANRFTVYLGTISYSLYLIHQHLATRVLVPEMIERWRMNVWLASALALVVVVLIASAITMFLEKPAMRLIRNAFYASSRRRQPGLADLPGTASEQALRQAP
jgi:peptidoglycan/LPS O-acetylase OafA/YrhL